ncbi:amidohydrolase family protein [Membranicola marinus]|uniref:Amidohydrolase family protein n=1 Tax=Membranihabitans marinus TaxID=1227546 RepID=A0A953HTF6_9BACT|nr:amidohydrolase family protein [Membranihabitans marinus]MBY5958015.1 amidohydrolase family protein [Membranihabitans marinus]
MEFVSKAHQAGVKIVTSSHTSSPYSEPGWTYQREMELLAEAGLSPMDIIYASTLLNAQYFRSEQRIGSVEAGKFADLILLDENPLVDISNVKKVSRVMFNGTWVE